MEGNMRGPSIQDCEKSFARTGVPSKNLLRKKALAGLGQGAAVAGPSGPRAYEAITWVARK
jgi:hypothetical protein